VLAISAYYVILAASWNMLAGFTGQFSLAQHAFAAIGAYASGLLVYHLKTPVWLSIPLGVCAAGLGGFLLGILVLHMRAIYLSIAPGLSPRRCAFFSPRPMSSPAAI